jgi:hypothetical protein
MKRWMTYITMAFGIVLLYAPKPALAQEIPSAETNAAPAAAALQGTIYAAWMGKNTPPASVWYYPNASGSQQQINGTKTMYAPAFAANGSTLYLAYAAQSTGYIYYLTNTGSGWSSASAPVCNGSICAAPTAAPALAVSGTTLYLAWTNSSNGIEFASNAGAGWTFGPMPPVTASKGTAPALAVYNDTVFLAWLPPGSSQVNYATLPLSGGSWSVNPFPAPTTVTSVAPALGVYAYGFGSLYLAWTSASGTLYYSEWNGSGWNTAVAVTGLSAAPGQLTPALVSNAAIIAVCPNPVTNTSFSLVYGSPVYSSSTGQLEYYDLYTKQLLSNLVGRCTCHGTTCQ